MEKLKYGSTLKAIQSNSDELTWIFIPGGPGIESGYFGNLIQILRLKGSVFTFDLPRRQAYSEVPSCKAIVKTWSDDLKEVVSRYKNVVLVGHSFGGMLMMATQEIENRCKGFVFLASSPNRAWLEEANKATQIVDAPMAAVLEERFQKNPSDELFKQLCIAWAPYYFLGTHQKQGIELLSKTTYNDLAYFGANEFLSNYRVFWKPWTTPTLCTAGANDLITPLHLFRNDETFQKPHVQFVEIPNAGHFPWVENPSHFTEAILSFQSKLLT